MFVPNTCNTAGWKGDCEEGEYDIVEVVKGGIYAVENIN